MNNKNESNNYEFKKAFIELLEEEISNLDEDYKDSALLYRNFIGTCSTNLLLKIAVQQNKLVENEYIAHHDIMAMGGSNYNSIKQNTVKPYSEDNKSYIFGLVKETEKGYYYNKDICKLSTYEITDEFKNFVIAVNKLVQKYDLTVEYKNQELLILKKNAIVKSTELKFDTRFRGMYFETKEQEEIYNKLLLDLNHYKNVNSECTITEVKHYRRLTGKAGRGYSELDKLSTEQICSITKGAYSYKMKSGMLHFLQNEAKNNNVQTPIIDYVIENKYDVALSIAKKTFKDSTYGYNTLNKLIFLDELTKSTNSIDIVKDLFNEINELSKALKLYSSELTKNNDIYAKYEIWQRETLDEVISTNELEDTDYLILQEEIVSYKKLIEYDYDLYLCKDYNTRYEEAQLQLEIRNAYGKEDVTKNKIIWTILNKIKSTKSGASRSKKQSTKLKNDAKLRLLRIELDRALLVLPRDILSYYTKLHDKLGDIHSSAVSLVYKLFPTHKLRSI